MTRTTDSVVVFQNKIMALELFEKERISLKSGSKLMTEFNRVFNMNWTEPENNALFNLNLTELSKFHFYLIKRALAILNKEKSQVNQDYVRNHLILDETFKMTEEGRSGDGILLFHEEGTQFIIGDIHSDDESLENILVKSYFPLYLSALISENRSFDAALLPAYLNCFDQLPYIAFIKKKIGFIQCVQGGLPRSKSRGFKYLKTLSGLTQLEQEEDNIIHNLMWSDPYRGTGDLKAHMKRFYFTKADFSNYKAHFGIALLFRGHEVAKEGVQSYFEETLFTVFSSGETESTYYKGVSPKIVKLDAKGHYCFL